MARLQAGKGLARIRRKDLSISMWRPFPGRRSAHRRQDIPRPDGGGPLTHMVSGELANMFKEQARVLLIPSLRSRRTADRDDPVPGPAPALHLRHSQDAAPQLPFAALPMLRIGLILTSIRTSDRLSPMNSLRHTVSGMMTARAGQGRLGCAEKRFPVNLKGDRNADECEGQTDVKTLG